MITEPGTGRPWRRRDERREPKIRTSAPRPKDLPARTSFDSWAGIQLARTAALLDSTPRHPRTRTRPPRARSSPRQASSNAVPMTAARTAARSRSRWPPESETMEWFQNPPADESDWQADPARARHLRSGPIAPVDQHGAKDPSAAGTRPGKALSRQRGPPLSDTTLRSRQARSTRWGSYCLKDTAGDSPRRSRSPTPARPRW